MSIPCRFGRSSSSMVRNQFVAAFARQHHRGQSNGNGANSLETPRYCAHGPTLAQVPSGEEPLVVFEQVCLRNGLAASLWQKSRETITINAIPKAWTNADNATRMVSTPQPCSLFCLPPISSTANATIVMPSRTTAKDIRKPTDLHILQKYLSSPLQSV